jgi:hypothetical protein
VRSTNRFRIYLRLSGFFSTLHEYINASNWLFSSCINASEASTFGWVGLLFGSYGLLLFNSLLLMYCPKSYQFPSRLLLIVGNMRSLGISINLSVAWAEFMFAILAPPSECIYWIGSVEFLSFKSRASLVPNSSTLRLASSVRSVTYLRRYSFSSVSWDIMISYWLTVSFNNLSLELNYLTLLSKKPFWSFRFWFYSRAIFNNSFAI